jgi:hypothetical protein
MLKEDQLFHVTLAAAASGPSCPGAKKVRRRSRTIHLRGSSTMINELEPRRSADISRPCCLVIRMPACPRSQRKGGSVRATGQLATAGRSVVDHRAACHG